MALNPKKLGERALTFVVAGTILFSIVLFPPKWVFHSFLVLVGLVGVREFHRITEGLGENMYRAPVIFSVVYGILAIYLPQLDMSWLPYFVILITALMSLAWGKNIKHKPMYFGLTLVAAGYLCFSVVCLGWVFAMESASHEDLGRHLFLWFLLTVWAGDSFAYLGGSMFGKHKIAPIISPNKSWEGMIANLVGNAAALTLAKFTLFPAVEWHHVAALTLVFGVLGFFGDLVESSWKRGSSIKDSSSIFPGHGGILDRIDSIFLTAPIFYYYVGTVLGYSV